MTTSSDILVTFQIYLYRWIWSRTQ